MTFLEKAVYEDAAKALRTSQGILDRMVMEMGKLVGPPWRGEEKTAALAAWVALSGQ